MKKIITASIQVLPVDKSPNALKAIDKAIEVIQSSGLRYLVCPMETVVEGNVETIQIVFNQAIQEALQISDEIVVHCKWHISATRDLSMDDKMEKYR